MNKSPCCHPERFARRLRPDEDNQVCLFLIFIALAFCLITPASAQRTCRMEVDTGWNLLALPGRVTDGRREVLFPSAVSPAWVFRHPAGYQSQDTLQKGTGFWLKFNTSDTVSITVDVIMRDSVAVEAGWNLIGALSVPILIDSVRTDPPGIICSHVMGFVPGRGYQQADTLYPGRGYWVKVNQQGTIVLSGKGGWPCPGMPTIIYAGKMYNTVQIGNQCWLREDLNVGTMINGQGDQTNNGVIEKYCYYDDTSNCGAFGGLYQWQEVVKYRNTTQRVRGICPPGWHIPTLAELYALSAAVGGDGNALKAIGQGSGQGAGTNTSGFSALLAGYRETNGNFSDSGSNLVVWSSVGFDTTTAFGLVLSGLNAAVVLDGGDQHYGFSVRCLEGDAPNLPPLVPSNPSPPNGSTGQLSSLILSWSCGDPDGDFLTFDIYFGTTNPPAFMVSAGQSDTTCARNDLSRFTTYFWRVVAKDALGDSTSGPVWSFTTTNMGYPCPGLPTVEYAGRIYNTVEIVSQCWLRENIDVGTMINGSGPQTNNGMMEKYCYDNDTANCTLYGGLYMWREAMQYDSTQGVQGICPAGWHVPTMAEYQVLIEAVGGWFAGNALKAVGQGSGHGAGTNTSGFSALLAGIDIWWYGFRDLGQQTSLWTSTIYPCPIPCPMTSFSISLRDSDASAQYSGSSWEGTGFSVRCLAEEAPNPPPNPPSSPSPHAGATDVPLSTTLSWSCSDPDRDPITYDVYFGAANPPDRIVASDGSDTTLGRRGLTGGTWYYWRVVAKDGRDSTVGPIWSFRTVSTDLPCPGIAKVTYDGKVYHTVKIGSQCWLRENLDVGSMVPGSQDQTDNAAIEKYCYNDDPTNCDTFGGLYQWHEAMQYDTVQADRGICPPGWHMPTLVEFQTLDAMLGGDGNAVKAIGQGTGGGAGTNTSGFSALLAGRRSTHGSFESSGSFAYFWSSTQYDAADAHSLLLHSGSSYEVLLPQDLGYGVSVRCLKSQTSDFPPSAPSNPKPDSGATSVSGPLSTLSWCSSDPDGDPVYFDVYFGTVDPPGTLVASDQVDTSLAMSGLTTSTTYYWKVVAKDDHARSTAGPVWSFTTATMGFSCPGTPTVDYAGKVYGTVQISSQCWLRENLDVGTRINGNQNQANNDVIEKYCYGDNPANCDTYGGLYQWDEAMQYVTTPGAQGICPPGWHIPTLGEFQTLSATVGGDGNGLKAVGQGSGGGAGTDTSGFSALLAGERVYLGYFYGLRFTGHFWSSTQLGAIYARWVELSSGNPEIQVTWAYKSSGFSLRCLKD